MTREEKLQLIRDRQKAVRDAWSRETVYVRLWHLTMRHMAAQGQSLNTTSVSMTDSTVISAQGTAGHFYRLRRTIKM